MAQRPLTGKPEVALVQNEWFSFNSSKKDEDKELELLEKEVAAMGQSAAEAIQDPFVGETESMVGTGERSSFSDVSFENETRAEDEARETETMEAAAMEIMEVVEIQMMEMDTTEAEFSDGVDEYNEMEEIVDILN